MLSGGGVDFKVQRKSTPQDEQVNIGAYPLHFSSSSPQLMSIMTRDLRFPKENQGEFAR